MNNIMQEKIKEEADGYGKLTPAFIEGAKFALENQWISVDEDLPCNHKELLMINNQQYSETFEVFAINKYGDIWTDYMINENGKWRWNDFEPDFWMIAPKLSKE